MSLFLKLIGIRRPIAGGIYLPDEKAATARMPIADLSDDGPLHVPTQRAPDLPTKPVVSPGDTLLAGQALADPADPKSLPVYAPTSGLVVALDRCWTAAHGFMPAVTLVPDGRDTWMPAERSTTLDEPEDWQASGIVVPPYSVASSRSEALHVVLRCAREVAATDLIVSALETEPYLTGDLRTVIEKAENLLEATLSLSKAAGVRNAWLVVADRHRHAIRTLRAIARGSSVRIVEMSDKHPLGYPSLLAAKLLRRETAPGQSTLEIGVLVLPVAAVRAAADFLRTGRPQVARVVTVSGDAVEQPANLFVRFGTPISRLLDYGGVRHSPAVVLVGGPLTGVTVPPDVAVVTPDCCAVIALRALPRLDPIPCVRCGWCVDDCPVGINPVSLVQLERWDRCTEAEKAELNSCINCGICTYVCPAHLPLAETIAQCRIQPAMIESRAAVA
jgi:electron transport complex protein RnfC